MAVVRKEMSRKGMVAVKTRIRLKKNDMVKVISGRDKGKTGRVLEIDRERGRLLVEGVMLVKRHTNASSNAAGGENHHV